MIPSPGVSISIFGTTSSAQPIAMHPKTQYMTERAPTRSESQPPMVRVTADGKLKQAASSPAVPTDMA